MDLLLEGKFIAGMGGMVLRTEIVGRGFVLVYMYSGWGYLLIEPTKFA